MKELLAFRKSRDKKEDRSLLSAFLAQLFSTESALSVWRSVLSWKFLFEFCRWRIRVSQLIEVFPKSIREKKKDSCSSDFSNPIFHWWRLCLSERMFPNTPFVLSSGDGELKEVEYITSQGTEEIRSTLSLLRNGSSHKVRQVFFNYNVFLTTRTRIRHPNFRNHRYFLYDIDLAETYQRLGTISRSRL